MKKLLLLFLTSIIAISLIAQNNYADFRFIEDGSFVSKKNNTNYIVIDFPDLDRIEIYQKLLVGITDQYSSSSDIINKVEDHIISVNTILVDAYSEKALGIPLRKHIHCIFKFQIKDEKLRVDAPEIQQIITGLPVPADDNCIRFSLESSSYFKKGILKQKKEHLYDKINSAINTAINDIITKSFIDNDDW